MTLSSIHTNNYRLRREAIVFIHFARTLIDWFVEAQPNHAQLRLNALPPLRDLSASSAVRTTMFTCSDILPSAAIAYLAKFPTAGGVNKFPSDSEFIRHEHETLSKPVSWLLYLLNGIRVDRLMSQGWALIWTLAEGTARFLFNRSL
ncbi:MAG: hypothetical protein ACTS7I_01840 [Candidatus Hodgkinia cicadicola]